MRVIMRELVPEILAFLRHAGGLIMEVYKQDIGAAQVELKEDSSPLTLADRLSHNYLTEKLNQLDASIPMLSEESVHERYETRKQWDRYWCLDPLDGTKEFIKHNDQFTINLALIENQVPVMGFIHVPVSGHTYWAVQGGGAFLDDGIRSLPIRANRKESEWIAVGSGSHGSEEEQHVLREFPISQFIKAGSALKFALIASGMADVYYRHGPTMEWDTAAGHILVEEAGARFQYVSAAEVHYNKESLYNTPFLVQILP